MATEAPKEEPAQVKEEMEGSKAPEESGVAEEPEAVEEPEHTEEQKGDCRGGLTNETGKAIKQATVAAPTNTTTPATPANPTLSPAAPTSSFAWPPVDKPSEHERPKQWNNRKIGLLEGPYHPSIAVYRKCGSEI